MYLSPRVGEPYISTQINLPYTRYIHLATITAQLYYERNVLFARMATRFNLVSFDVVATALAVARTQRGSTGVTPGRHRHSNHVSLSDILPVHVSGMRFPAN